MAEGLKAYLNSDLSKFLDTGFQSNIDILNHGHVLSRFS